MAKAGMLCLKRAKVCLRLKSRKLARLKKRAGKKPKARLSGFVQTTRRQNVDIRLVFFIIKRGHFPAACCEKQSKIDKFWTDGYYVSTVSQHGNEETIRGYVEEQGIEEDYRQIHDDEQLKLF